MSTLEWLRVFYSYVIINVVAPNYVRANRVSRYKHAKHNILCGISKTTAFFVGTSSTLKKMRAFNAILTVILLQSNVKTKNLLVNLFGN